MRCVQAIRLGPKGSNRSTSLALSLSLGVVKCQERAETHSLATERHRGQMDDLTRRGLPAVSWRPHRWRRAESALDQGRPAVAGGVVHASTAKATTVFSTDWGGTRWCSICSSAHQTPPQPHRVRSTTAIELRSTNDPARNVLCRMSAPNNTKSRSRQERRTARRARLKSTAQDMSARRRVLCESRK
jgi:hypothetical protein